MYKPFIRPKRLPPGGTIGVIAPAGRVDLDQLHCGVTYLEQIGFRVILGRHLTKGHRYFSGEDKDRANDFLDMMQNKEVDAVLCARGGSGSARMIPYLDQIDSLPPKIFVGSSDVTTLLLHLSQKYGLVTFHGPMVATQFGKIKPEGETAPVGLEYPKRGLILNHLLQVLSGEKTEMRAAGMMALKHGVADGILTGGCLTLICTTIGTPYEIDTEDRILFIEDIGEAPYRIDRMLYYLKTLNKFNNIRGLMVGQMPGCQPEALPEVILEILSDFDFPILFGFPSGHGDAIFTLPIGADVRMNTEGVPSLTMLTPAVLSK